MHQGEATIKKLFQAVGASCALILSAGLFVGTYSFFAGDIVALKAVETSDTRLAADSSGADQLEFITPEEAWRSGKTVTPVPDTLERSTPYFISSNQDVQSAAIVDGEHIQVYYTNDPAFNCGAAGGHEPGAIYGCYDATYGRALFMYWDHLSSEASRLFVLHHELSHYVQWRDHYNLMEAANKQGLFSNPSWVTSVETDASCRALSWGGHAPGVDKTTSAPCNVSNWSGEWLVGQAQAFGLKF